jgi:hypothetical protein
MNRGQLPTGRPSAGPFPTDGDFRTDGDSPQTAAPNRRRLPTNGGPDIRRQVAGIREFDATGFTHVALVEVGGHTRPPTTARDTRAGLGIDIPQ